MEECPRCGSWKHPDESCRECGYYGSESDYVEEMRRAGREVE